MKIHGNVPFKKADAVFHNILFKKLRIFKNTNEQLITLTKN